MDLEQAIERIINLIQYMRYNLSRTEGQGYQDMVNDIKALEKLVEEARKGPARR